MGRPLDNWDIRGNSRTPAPEKIIIQWYNTQIEFLPPLSNEEMEAKRWQDLEDVTGQTTSYIAKRLAAWSHHKLRLIARVHTEREISLDSPTRFHDDP